MFEVGTEYAVTYAPARNGEKLGRVRTMKSQDGPLVTLFHEDPTNPLSK